MKKYQPKCHNRINFSYYPMGDILSLATQGDLFVLHIKTEAKVLYDAHEFFKKIDAFFHFKESYQKEIIQVSELGWFLISISSNKLDASMFNKRVAWCVRTILIAKSADNRNPVFSA